MWGMTGPCRTGLRALQGLRQVHQYLGETGLPIVTAVCVDDVSWRELGRRPDKAAIDRFIGELSFGGGAVNHFNINLFIETMPFGGVDH